MTYNVFGGTLNLSLSIFDLKFSVAYKNTNKVLVEMFNVCR